MSEAETLNLPSGWALTPVGDLLKFKNGLNKGKAFFGHGTPIVNYMDVFNHTGLRSWDVQGLVDVNTAEKKAFSARRGDVLLTRTSETPEEVGISTVLLDELQDAVFSGFVLRGRPLNERLTPEFAQYCFGSRFVRDQIVSSATYTTRALTNGRILSGIKLPLPDCPNEQQAIAAALSDADGVVAGLERVIAKKRLIKQGAMQDLLTARRRLPGFSGEWGVKRLVQLGDVKTGLTYRPDNVKPFGTLVLRSSNIQNDRLAFENNVFVDVAVSDEATVKSGDLLICARNGSRQLIGKTAMIDSSADGMAFGAFMSAFRSDINDYLVWCFQSSIVQNQIAENLGATINQITNKTLKSIEIPLPDDDRERHAIAAVLSDMDAEIQTLTIRLTKARAVKEGMMQALLTGRVRLV
jgi:type I restriction enzyme S subunit